MAMQKSKKSRSKTHKKRANSFKLKGVIKKKFKLIDGTFKKLLCYNYATDPVSGELHRNHHVTAGGFYKGKKVILLKDEKTA